MTEFMAIAMPHIIVIWALDKLFIEEAGRESCKPPPPAGMTLSNLWGLVEKDPG